jgi:hypothetical protein
MERRDPSHRLRSRHTPVLIFTGSRSAGKTALLDAVESRLDQRVPYARIDFETTKAVSTHEVLSALAFDLNRHCATYGRIAFPRFVVGRIVMAQKLDFTNMDAARAKIEATLEDYRNIPRLREFLSGLGSEVLTAVPGLKIPGSLTISKYLPNLLLDGLRSWRGSRRVVLGSGQDWYGHQDRGLDRGKALDVLAGLNRRAQQPDGEDDRRAVDELLLAAFLADLRAGFGRGWRAPRQTLNCVMLLDNADNAGAQAFLADLVEARRLHSAKYPDDPDPVTVVATSRGPLVSQGIADGAPVVRLDEARFDLAVTPDAGQTRRWWYAVALRALTRDEVGNMVGALSLQRGSDRQLAESIYRFTRGHPGSTRLLIKAIAERPDDAMGLPSILDRREPGAQGSATVRGTLETSFLAGFPKGEAAMHDLVTCAAARDLPEASRLAAQSGLLIEAAVEEPAVLASELWTDGGDGRPKVLQPVLRRLLLLRLAARDDDDPANWSRVHTWLCEKATRTDDEAGVLHHTLARGQLEAVTRVLAERIEDPDTNVAAWLDLVRSTVAAPAPLDPAAEDHLQRLTRWTDPRDVPTAPIARLVAALWIDADPLAIGSRRGLHQIAEAAYRQVAAFSRGDQAALHAEAERHRALADLWR